MENEKYLLGLDLGVSSLGWCLCDQNNHIVKYKGEKLWGVRLFDQVSDDNNAKTRRMARTARRRLARRKQRIRILRQIFYKYICDEKYSDKPDKYFFERMDLSFFQKEELLQKSSHIDPDKERLFGGLLSKNELKKIYLNSKKDGLAHSFNSIYELRNYLMTTNEKADIRLIYLACHHILKYRGNFLYPKDFKPKGSIEIVANELSQLANCMRNIEKELMEKFCDSFKDSSKNILDDVEAVEQLNADKFMKIFRLNAPAKEKDKALNIEHSKYFKSFLPGLLLRGKVSYKKLLSFIESSDLPDDEIDVDGDNFEENLDYLSSYLGEDSPFVSLLAIVKKIFDVASLLDLLDGSTYLSEAMIKKYDQHHKDKAQLKRWIKAHVPADEHRELYRKIFTSTEEEANYVNYVGSNHGNKKGISSARLKVNKKTITGYEAFNKFLLSEIEKRWGKDYEDEELKQITDRLKNNTFLSNPRSLKNGQIPYQVHKVELERIIENQSRFYPFLKENKEKLIRLLSFRIPYYVGPLSNSENQQHPFAWVKFADDNKEEITPFNFEKKINFEETRKHFIERMTNGCTYLPSCKALPRYSLLYSEYACVTKLNQFKLNNRRLTWDDEREEITIKKLLDGYFKKQISPTLSGLKEFIKSFLPPKSKIDLTYLNGESVNKNDIPSLAMKSWVDFHDYDLNNPTDREFVERAIYLKTIFKDGKEEFKKQLIKEFKDRYTLEDSEELERISRLRYTKFGKLSKELLTLRLKNGHSVLNTLEEESTQLSALFDKNDLYGIKEAINNFNKNHEEKEITPEDYISHLAISPKAKRPLMQAYRLIEELQKITGKRIDEYYVECTRELSLPSGKGTKSSTRYDQLQDKLASRVKAIKKDKNNSIYNGDLITKSEELSHLSPNEQKELDKDRRYLYEKQLGICPYCGKPLEGWDRSVAEIDHIIPRSLKPLESVEINKVLVHRGCNQAKGPQYPIPSKVLLEQGRNFTEFLYQNDLITKEKYDAILRTEPITEEDFKQFTSEQLTATSQAVKAAINFITLFEKTDDGKAPRVIYSKAALVSEFRKSSHILKLRDANNLHHAHDAYLNVIVGRMVDCYFGWEHDTERFKRWQEELKKIQSEYNEDTDKTEYLQKLTNVYIKAFGIINPIDSKKINGLKQQNWYPIRDRSENEFWIYKDLKSIEDIRTNINHLSHTIKVSYRSFIKNRVIQQKTFNPAYDKKNALISLKKDLDVRKYGGYANAEYGFMSLLKQKNKYLLFPISNLSISKEIKSDEKLLKDFIAKEYGKKCEVVVPVIPWNVLLRQNGSLYTLSGKSGNNIYAQSFYEFILSPEKYDILRKVINVYDKVKLEIKAEAKKNKDKKDNFSNKLKDLYEVVDDSIVVLSKDDEGKPRKKFSTSDLDVLYDEYQAKLSSEQFRKMNTNVNVKKISDRFLNPGNKFKFQNAELADKIQFIYQVSKVCTSMYKKETTFEKCGDIDGFFLSKPYISSNLSDGFEIYKLSVTGLKKFVYFKDSNE